MSQARWNFLLTYMCIVMTTKNECNSSWIAKLSTLWYVGFWTFILLSNNFLLIWWIYFFFQDTYNSYMKERYRDNPLTHLDFNTDLWLKVGLSSGKPYRNQVYELFNTTIKNLQMTRNVSNVKYSQSVPSIQTLKFEAMLNQWVQD
jgi:hypothetical protein